MEFKAQFLQKAAKYTPMEAPEAFRVEAQHAKKYITPLMQQFKVASIDVQFVSTLGRGHIARYIRGSAPNISVVIDLKRIQKSPDFDDEIHLSIYHELGHALVEMYEQRDRMESDDQEEEEVENFARMWWFQHQLAPWAEELLQNIKNGDYE